MAFDDLGSTVRRVAFPTVFLAVMAALWLYADEQRIAMQELRYWPAPARSAIDLDRARAAERAAAERDRADALPGTNVAELGRD